MADFVTVNDNTVGMGFQAVKLPGVSKKVIGIANGDGFLFPNRFYATQEEADAGMLSLAQSEIERVNHHYNSRRTVKNNDDGTTTLSKPGRRSDADIALLQHCEDWVAGLEGAQQERDAIARFKATLTPEQLAVLEG